MYSILKVVNLQKNRLKQLTLQFVFKIRDICMTVIGANEKHLISVYVMQTFSLMFE